MNQQSIVRLSAEERRQLTALIRQGKAAAAKIRQAHLLLQAEAAGPAWTEARIAARVSVRVPTVPGVRQRVVEQGLEAAHNRKQQARPSRAPL
jgi:hypothetical protein